MRIVLLVIMLCCPAFLLAQNNTQPSAAQQEDVEQFKILERGVLLLQSRHANEALEQFESVITFYENKHRGRAEQVYCARNAAETLYYLTKHASRNPQRGAIVVRGWCDALYLKGYVLVELKRLEEAKGALLAAVALSPENSQYLSELGHVYERERDWPKALENYKAAEQAAQLASPQMKAGFLARAQRGVGYVLIELGNLDEAESKFKQSLEAEDNVVAKKELEYIRGLREKQGGNQGR